MAGRCGGCDGRLPTGARFCPACGRRAGDDPLTVPLTGDDDLANVELGVSGRGGRRLLLGAATAAVLVMAASAVSRDGGGTSAASTTSPTTAAPSSTVPRTTTTRRTGLSTTTAAPPTAVVEVVEVPEGLTGMVLISDAGATGASLLDLATGRTLSVPADPYASSFGPVPVIDGRMVLTREGRTILVDGDGTSAPVEFSGDAGGFAFPLGVDGDGTGIWVLDGGGGPTPAVQRYAADGTLVEERTTPGGLGVIGAWGDTLVLSAPGRLYRWDTRTDRVESNDLAAEGATVAGRWLTGVRCGDDLTCRRVLVDLDSGRETVLPGTVDPAFGWYGGTATAITPDGSLVAIPALDPERPQMGPRALRILTVDGEELASLQDPTVASGVLAWTSDGTTLVSASNTWLSVWKPGWDAFRRITVGRPVDFVRPVSEGVGLAPAAG